MSTMETPFGLATVTQVADSATVPNPMLMADGTDGTPRVSAFDLPRVSAAPNWDPSLVPGRPRTVFRSTDSKIYVWTTGTTWVASAALA